MAGAHLLQSRHYRGYPFCLTMWIRLDPHFVFYRVYRGGGRNDAIFIVDTGYASREWMQSFRGTPGPPAPEAAPMGIAMNGHHPEFFPSGLHVLST